MQPSSPSPSFSEMLNENDKAATGPRSHQHHPYMKKHIHYRHTYVKRKASSYQCPPQQQQQPMLGDYCMGKTIGRGASGRVKIGIHRETGEQVAIKIISRSRLAQSSSMALCVQRELAILHLLHHPHVVHLRQVLQDSSHVYFVMDYVDGGELYHVLTEHGRLTETKAKHLFGQLASALIWCHSHHICHRDLKPENLLLDKAQENLKVVDFGMATIQSPDWLLKTSCGSPHYASPEIVRGKPYNGYATDVWSAGVILYAMLTGRLPFDGSSAGSLLSKIKSGRYLPLPSHVSRDAKDLIKRMLMVNPSKRITIQEVLLHPWLTRNSNNTSTSKKQRHPSPMTSPLLHNHALQGPIIHQPMDIDNRSWEMLKVLWKSYNQKELLAALTSDSPNVPKLTCHLLQQRACHEDTYENTPPWSPLYRPYSCSSSCSTITHDSGISCCGGVGIGSATPIVGAIALPDTGSTMTCLEQSDPTTTAPSPPCKSPSICSSTGSSSLEYATPTSTNPTLSRWLDSESSLSAADPLVAQFAHVHSILEPTSMTSSSAAIRHLHRLQTRSPLLNTTTTRLVTDPWRAVSSWFGVARDWCVERLADREQTMHAHANKVYVLERHAKCEREAAGKLQQILQEHFHGTLQKRVYKNDKVIWDGSMKIDGHHNTLHFMCHISAASARKGKVKVGFVLVKGDQATMDDGMDRILKLWNKYEQDARAVAMANGWLLDNNNDTTMATTSTQATTTTHT